MCRGGGDSGRKGGDRGRGGYGYPGGGLLPSRILQQQNKAIHTAASNN